jgi:hypothetical protein
MQKVPTVLFGGRKKSATYSGDENSSYRHLFKTVSKSENRNMMLNTHVSL